MARAATRTRPRRFGILRLLLFLLFLGGAILATIYLVNDRQWPWKTSVFARGEDHQGKIPIPIAAQPVPAFELVEMNNLVDPKTRKVRLQWIDKDKAQEKGFIVSYTEIVGRVLSHDKAAGYAFTESDFYPKGSHPTPALALDQGKRGIYISPDKVDGLGGLKRFDHFDLMAVKLATGAQNRAAADMRYSAPDLAKAQAENGVWDAPSRVLVQDGKVIVPLPERASRNKNADQMYIQVDDDEVNALNEALATGARISCVSRSAIAGAKVEPLPAPAVAEPVEEIEVLSGTKSRVYVVPAGKGGAQEFEEKKPVQDAGSAPVKDSQVPPKKSEVSRGQ